MCLLYGMSKIIITLLNHVLSLSSWLYVSNGVRQSRILSPILFNAYMYIDDVNTGLTELRMVVILGCCCKIILFMQMGLF